jgi:lysophospholipase L1-like esterase
MRMRWHRLAPIFGVLFALTALAPTAQASNVDPPKHFYLALGDSAAFGIQLGKFFQELSTGTYDPRTFNTGYVDDFAARLRSVGQDEALQAGDDSRGNRQIETVNLSCPGETTDSFTKSCLFKVLGFALHTDYSGSQESAALSFLRTHPGQVSPITIDLGLADALLPCAGPTFLVDVACIHTTMPGALQSLRQNLPDILADLKQASPSSEIIVMTYYNPFFVEDTSTDALISPLNEEIASIAAARKVRVADAFKPFNRSGNEADTLCTLTLMCPNRDYHPSDAGYKVIAQQFWTASGYGRHGD